MATTETPNDVSPSDISVPPEQLEVVPFDDGDDTKPERKPVRPAAKREAPAPRDPNPLAGAQAEEQQNWREYFQSLAGSSPFRIEVIRKKPETMRYKGRQIDCSGHLASYEDLIDEEFIRERHGGGTFLLRFMVPGRGKDGGGTGGGYKYAGSKQLKIAGDPRIEEKWLNAEEQPQPTQPASGFDPAVKHFVGILEKEVERKDRKLDELANRSQLDPTLISMIVEPLRQQLAAAAAQNERLASEIAAIRNAPEKATKGDEFRDKLLDKMMDGESARITAMKANHESELRQLKENHHEEVKRLEARHDRSLADLRAQHEREVSLIKMVNENGATTMNQSHNIAKSLLEQTVQRLEREVTRLEKELDELRGKKDKSLVEQIKDIETVKKLFEKDEDGEEEEKKSPWVQGIEALGIGNVLQGVAGKLMSGGGEAPPAQQQPQIPVGARWRGQDGNAYLMTPNGPVMMKPKQVTAGPAAPPRRPQVRTEVQVNPETGEPVEVQVAVEEGPPPVVIPPDKLALVKNMLEGAFTAGTDPRMVAQTAKTMAPGAIPAITQAIGSQGVDAFLNQMAAFDGNSPLAQQDGRNFLRKVAKALMGE